MAESHRQHRRRAGLADAQPERTGAEPSAGCVSVRNPATLPVLILGGADDAYPLEDRACPRSFSSSETASRRRAATRRPELPVQRRRGRHASLRRHSPSPAASTARATPHVAENASSNGRVEAHASASSNASPPRSRAIRMRRSASVHVTRATDPTMTDKLAVPMPHRPLKPQRQLVTTTPSLHLRPQRGSMRLRAARHGVDPVTSRRDDARGTTGESTAKESNLPSGSLSDPARYEDRMGKAIHPRPENVHCASTRFASASHGALRAYTPLPPCLQGFRGRPLASVNPCCAADFLL